jgi:hypothetical protein
MKHFLILFSSLMYVVGFSQNISSDRLARWDYCGVRDSSTQNFTSYTAAQIGFVNDGITDNSTIWQNFLSTVGNSGTVLLLDSGYYLFQSTLNLPSHFALQGQSAANTHLIFDLNNSGNAIQCFGSVLPTPYPLLSQAMAFESHVLVTNASDFTANDYIKISLNDSLLVTSSWAYGSVGQIARVASVSGDTLFLQSELRFDFPLNLHPKIQKLLPKENIGLSCFSIERMDNTSPQQTSSISFYCAANCWIHGIESTNCTFAHVQAATSTNLSIDHSYFHHAFEYGDGGRGYGIDLEFSTGECLIVNNVFEHLRHSMLLQAGANGNSFVYNYSTDPYWVPSSAFIPTNSAGEIVLHGNYVFRNLFEMNSVGNIVIDNSHGANGPYNTFLRNRASLFGIFFSDASSPSQNLIGNEIPNTSFPYSSVNYTIQGSDQFEFGNNNKGNITPSGTENVIDLSYMYTVPPSFLPNGSFACMGSPNTMGTGKIPGENRFELNAPLGGTCGIELPTSIFEQRAVSLFAFPVPTSNEIILRSSQVISTVQILNVQGQLLEVIPVFAKQGIINFSEYPSGIYYGLTMTDQGVQTVKLVRE